MEHGRGSHAVVDAFITCSLVIVKRVIHSNMSERKYLVVLLK
jgi:hypothetical protein